MILPGAYEAQFKTLKYRPEFPQRFGSLQHARAFCRAFFHWYNNVQRHSGIAFMAPDDVRHGRAPQILAARAAALDAAFAVHPERFKGRRPMPQSLPQAVWINPPADESSDQKEGAYLHQLNQTAVSFSLIHSALVI